MLGEPLIALAVLTLLCLYGSGDQTSPYESTYVDQNNDLFDE